MIPKQDSNPGILIEIKHSKSKSQISSARLGQIAKNAITQIKDKDYLELLRNYDCKEAILFGVNFWSKNVAVASERIDK